MVGPRIFCNFGSAANVFVQLVAVIWGVVFTHKILIPFSLHPLLNSVRNVTPGGVGIDHR